MGLILNLLISTIAVLISAYIIPGAHVDTFVTALIVAILLGTFNTFIKPVLVLLTLPITILTLGLFSLVINTLLIMLVDYLVPGFSLASILSAFLFSIVLSLINSFLSAIAK